jgi:hypothetical protein
MRSVAISVTLLAAGFLLLGNAATVRAQTAASPQAAPPQLPWPLGPRHPTRTYGQICENDGQCPRETVCRTEERLSKKGGFFYVPVGPPRCLEPLALGVSSPPAVSTPRYCNTDSDCPAPSVCVPIAGYAGRKKPHYGLCGYGATGGRKRSVPAEK